MFSERSLETELDCKRKDEAGKTKRKGLGEGGENACIAIRLYQLLGVTNSEHFSTFCFYRVYRTRQSLFPVSPHTGLRCEGHYI